MSNFPEEMPELLKQHLHWLSSPETKLAVTKPMSQIELFHFYIQDPSQPHEPPLRLTIKE